MSHVVCEPCRGCKYTDCVAVCPVDCFHEGEDMLYIDPEVCTDCELCVPECPVEAIFRDLEVPRSWQDYIQLNAQLAPSHPTIYQTQDPMPGAPPRPR
jgi:ferredoxin